MKFFLKIKKFLLETKTEVKKVSWPTMKQTLRNSFIVIGASIILIIFLGGLDLIFTWIINRLIIK